MFQRKSLPELKTIMNEIKTYLTQIDEMSGRDASSDISLIPLDDFNFILSSADVELIDKKKIVLHQIGILRNILFSAFNFQIDRYEKDENYWSAIELMDQYLESVAVPFIGNLDGPSSLDRIKDFFKIKRTLSPREYVQKWRECYSSWPEIDWNSPVKMYNQRRNYREMRSISVIIYGLSFSKDNFPAIPSIVYVDDSV